MPSLQQSFLHPSHLAALLPALGPGAMRRLQHSVRLSPRLLAMLTSGLPPLPDRAAVPVERLALRTAAGIDDAGRMMGAVWHRRAISQCIDAPTIAALDEAIGREARLFGLQASIDLPAVPVPTRDLAGAVAEDGRRCLLLWRDRLDPPYRALAALKLPARAAPDFDAPVETDRAWRVIAWVAESLAAESLAAQSLAADAG